MTGTFQKVQQTGLGQKGVYHWRQRTFENAALDALAMNLNDLAVMRREAKKLHNHIIIQEEDEEAILEVIGTLGAECKKRGIIMDSGETSIQDNIIGFDVSVTITGEMTRKSDNKFASGDYLIGIQSSGLHSNGFTRVRKVFGEELRKEFVEPTQIYYDTLISLIKDGARINGMAHITGGAYAKNLKNPLGKNLDVFIERNPDLKPQSIFYEIKERGEFTDEEMYKTFNCGVGFVLSVPKTSNGDLREIIERLTFENGTHAYIFGEVTNGNGNVRIQSSFSDGEIVL